MTLVKVIVAFKNKLEKQQDRKYKLSNRIAKAEKLTPTQKESHVLCIRLCSRLISEQVKCDRCEGRFAEQKQKRGQYVQVVRIQVIQSLSLLDRSECLTRSMTNPINLVLDCAHCLVLVEQAHLIGLCLLDHQVRLLQVVDRVLSQDSFVVHHVELQVCVLSQDQQLQSLVKAAFHVPQSTALRKDSNLHFESSFLVVLYDGLYHRQVEYSYPQLSVLCRVISDFHVHGAFLFLACVHDFAAHRVCVPRVLEERVDIVSAFSQRGAFLPELSHQPAGVFRNLDQKHLIDGSSRSIGLRFTACIVAKGECAGNILVGFGYGEVLNQYVEIALDFYWFCWLLLLLHFQINTVINIRILLVRPNLNDVGLPPLFPLYALRRESNQPVKQLLHRLYLLVLTVRVTLVILVWLRREFAATPMISPD